MYTAHKILRLAEFQELKTQLEEYILVFTNGCFDLLHPGHIDLLQRSKKYGDLLLVGLNSDQSIQRIKGYNRPIMSETERAKVLSGLACVDFVIIFKEDTPLPLIRAVQPQVLIKGGDWPVEEIVGREVVQAQNGLVLSLPLLQGHSSSRIIQRIIRLHAGQD